MNPAILFGHLNTLGKTIGERPTGSLSNRQAMEYIGKQLECFGYPVRYQLFDGPEWNIRNVSCRINDKVLPVVVNPYSSSCTVSAPIIPVKNLMELRNVGMLGSIAIMHGDLTKEPLMPKNFPFYTHESHQEIIRLLEEKKPDAVICISPKSDPVPVIIDGDFPIPSCTIGFEDGLSLLDNSDGMMSLKIEVDLIRGRAANVICVTPNSENSKKIVLCAHFDTKYFTPGSLDNASGVAALLILADRLRRNSPDIPLEFVFFNGEEHYQAPGEIAYFTNGNISTDTVCLAINIDGIGLSGYPSSIAYFSCPPVIQKEIEDVLTRYPGIEPVDPWPSGDHMIFSQKGIPTLAFTTSAPWEVIENIIHTRSDTPDLLDIGRIMHTIDAIEGIIRKIGKNRSDKSFSGYISSIIS